MPKQTPSQPGTDRPSQFPKREKPKAVTLLERRRMAKEIQKDRRRSWSEQCYEPNNDIDDDGA